jgi:hypothetical protein
VIAAVFFAGLAVLVTAMRDRATADQAPRRPSSSRVQVSWRRRSSAPVSSAGRPARGALPVDDVGERAGVFVGLCLAIAALTGIAYICTP